MTDTFPEKCSYGVSISHKQKQFLQSVVWCQRCIFNRWPRALALGLSSAVQVNAVPLTEKEGTAISGHPASFLIAYEEQWVA